MSKTALILVGGGTRGAIHGGACLAFEELGVRFDFTICVSVGVCTGIFLSAGQVQNAYPVWTDHIPGDRFIRWRMGKPAMDAPYLLRSLRDVGKLNRSRIGARGRLICVLTDLQTGKPEYVEITPASDPWRALRASIAVPPLLSPITIGQISQAADGGLSDPLPIAYALSQGCSDITVVFTRPSWHRETPVISAAFARLFAGCGPQITALVQNAARRYNAAYRIFKNPPGGVRLRGIYPPTLPWMHFFTTDPRTLRAWFWHGYQSAHALWKSALRPQTA